MSAITGLFGGDQQTVYAPVAAPPPPTPLPEAPRISNAAVDATGREFASRLRRRYGTEKTILGGLGDVGTRGNAQNVQRATLLGGGGA